MQELYDGLEAMSQNRWPSLDFDIGALNSLLSPFLGAGFYYKTFMWPAAFWEKLYEPFIRKAAGLGTRHLRGRSGLLREVLGALRPAGHRRRPGRSCRRADRRSRRCSRHPRRRSIRCLAARCCRRQRRSAAKPAPAFAAQLRRRTAQPAQCAHACRAPQSSAGMTAMSSARWSACRSMSAVPTRTVPVERFWRIVAKQRDPRHRRRGAAAGVRRQRYSRRDDGRRHAHLSQPLRRRPRQAAPRSSPPMTAAMRSPAISKRAGIEVAAIIDSRAGCGRSPVRARRASSGRGRHRCQGRQGAVSRSPSSTDGAAETINVDALAMSGGFSPIIHLACHRGGKPHLVGCAGRVPGARQA